jgi:signal recognition particle receptor subunit beta
MVQVNFASKEFKIKVVFYGPGMSGKTTNLEMVHKKAPQGSTGELISIATEGDRTLVFDYLPLDLGKIGEMDAKFQLYTVPGQTFYNSTRKFVLQGVDGVIFVADSQKGKMKENVESLLELYKNLKEIGINIQETPLAMQWNKRDLPDIMEVDLM